MKYFKFLFLILTAILGYSITSYGQNNCSAYLPSESDFVRVVEGECIDPESSLPNYNGEIKFNLRIINVGKSDESNLLTIDEINDIKSSIEQVYTPHNIKFVYEVIPVNSTVLYENLYSEEYSDIITNYSCNSIVGLVSRGHTGNNESPINSGTFITQFQPGKEFQRTFCHELGHSIGLLHTFRSDSGSQNEKSSENIARVDQSTCECDCLLTGDMVCDTPADPTIPTQGLYSIGCDDVYNTTQLKDDCLVVYGDEMLPLIGNVMTYSISECGGHISDGQERLIREKLNVITGLQEKLHTEAINFSNINEINSPVTISSNTKFNSDVVVNSELTISNATIEFTSGHGFTVSPGGTLVINNNSTIRTSNVYCSGIWKGIEILPGSSGSTRVSILDNSTLSLSEAGIYNPQGTSGGVKLKVYNSTIDGPSIDLSNVYGITRLRDSDFNSTVKVTNAFSLRVLGCNFDFPVGSLDSGIKASDTRLYLHKYYDGGGAFSNCSFKNCGKAIEFISSGAHSIKVSETDFEEVLSGIVAISTAGSITVNDCVIGLRTPTAQNNFGKGILLDNFIDFGIYDNIITGLPGVGNVGITVKQTELNNNPNLIVNNLIEDCSQGVFTSGANLGNEMSGVEFSCNEFTNILGNHFSTTEIGPQQGRGTNNPNPRVAGNKFDGTTECTQVVIDAENCFSDFNFQGTGFQEADKKTYYYRDGVVNEEVPIYYNPGGQFTGVPLFSIVDLDNSVLPLCDYSGAVNNPNYPTPLPNPHSTYTDMFDGGDTGGDVTSVNNNSGSDPDGVINQVLSNSPWVSIPVVQAIFANSQNFTEAQVAQVIIQNPGVLGDAYIGEIVFESGSFSLANQHLMLLAYQAGDVRIDYQRSLLDVILYGTLTIKEAMENELVNGTFDQSVIRSHLAVKISHTKLYQTVESYVLEDDYQNALSTLNSRMGGYTFDPSKINEATAYAEILTMGMYLYNQDITWTKISNADKSRLTSIANSYNGLATNKARNILSIYHDMNLGIMPTKPAYSPIVFGQAIPRSITKAELIQVYPNPTDGYLNINGISSSYRFELITTDGRIVYSQLIDKSTQGVDISHLDNGIYFYQIKNGDEIIHIDKLIILE